MRPSGPPGRRARGGKARLIRRAGIAAVILVAAALGASGATAHAHSGARFYRGDIAASTSWEGTIRLTGTVVIREGITVTVDPGTEILVQPGIGADIVVKGRLLVRGTPGRPVLFDAAGGCPEGPWGGIVFMRGATGILENARLRCSTRGIAGDLTGVTRTGVTVHAGP